MSTIMGIHDGHNASVAVVRDGVVALALQEERLTRVKNQGDEPVSAIAIAKSMAGSKVPVALNGNYMNYGQWNSEYTSPSWLRESLKNTIVDRVYQNRKAHRREQRICALGFDQVHPVEHHLAHAAAAYFTSPHTKVLVFTCDGSGDRLSATVSIGDQGHLTRIAEVSEHASLGRFYSLVTRHLGMIPLEHEYKVMGLAPYARPSNHFEGYFEFSKNHLSWKRRKGTLRFRGRFDEIAHSAQALVENTLTRWVQAGIRETGIRNIACSGGVFMNVKANLRILELPEVEDMYVFPSCGDESNSIGAACWHAAQAGEAIQPLGALYYGDPISDLDAALALSARKVAFRHVADIESQVAEALALGHIVARAKGRAEFGARALGNRSILAPANSTPAVRELNESIKGRDFWMPFAPSVLSGRASDYYDKPKPVASPYMMHAFRSKPSKREALAAAIHPYDGTTRPQEVFEPHNPDYYRLLQEYESRTGEGAVLNTSFNLHGEPMVHSAKDAVDVFLRSGLRYMALANWWVEKQ